MRLFEKTPETRDEIVKLQRLAFGGVECAPDGVVHDIYGQPETEVYIARGVPSEGVSPLIGYALVTKKLNVGFDEPYIWSIAVRADARKQGVGGSLLDEVATTACEDGYEGTILICKTDNHPAIQVYTNHGYEVVRLLKRYYFSSDGLLMRRKLWDKQSNVQNAMTSSI